VQGLRTTVSSQSLDLDSSLINPTGWDSCRRPPSFHSTSAISLHNHSECLVLGERIPYTHQFIYLLSTLATTMRSSVNTGTTVQNLASRSTVTYTNDSLARSTIDHLHFSHVNHSLESITCSCTSILARQSGQPVQRSRRLPSTAGSEDSSTSTSESVNHLLYPHTSHLPASSTHLVHSPHSEQGRLLTPQSLSTPHASGEHRVPITTHFNGAVPDRGSLSDPECYSGTGYAMRRARRRLHVHGPQLTQASLSTEGVSRSLTILHPPNLKLMPRVQEPLVSAL
jgi:hypothetical protein